MFIWNTAFNGFPYFHILGIIIPTDKYVSEGLKPPTSFMFIWNDVRMFNFSIDWCPAKKHPAAMILNGPCRCRFPWSSKQPSGKMRLGTQVFGDFPCRFRWEISSINGGFHCIPLLCVILGGKFRVLETWNDQGRMILIIYYPLVN